MLCHAPSACCRLRPERSLQSTAGHRVNPALRTNGGEETNDRLDAAMEVGQVEFLIWRVQVVVRKSKAHHERRGLQLADEVADDGNGAASAYEDRLGAE